MRGRGRKGKSHRGEEGGPAWRVVRGWQPQGSAGDHSAATGTHRSSSIILLSSSSFCIRSLSLSLINCAGSRHGDDEQEPLDEPDEERSIALKIGLPPSVWPPSELFPCSSRWTLPGLPCIPSPSESNPDACFSRNVDLIKRKAKKREKNGRLQSLAFHCELLRDGGREGG